MVPNPGHGNPNPNPNAPRSLLHLHRRRPAAPPHLRRAFPLVLPPQPRLPSLPPSNLHPKSLYKTRFERDRARRQLAQRLAALQAESHVADITRRLEELRGKIKEETKKMKAAEAEISNLKNVRRSSVALNIWQPEVVRGRQKQVVEQCTVPIDSRLSALSMEIRVCKQQLTIYNKAYNDQKKRLKEGKEVLKSARYHPLQHFQCAVVANDCRMKRKR